MTKRVTSYIAAIFLLLTGAPVGAQAPVAAGPADPALIEDLVAASRILAMEGVLDGLGHVSIRHPSNSERYLMARSVAPALVVADDIMEYDLNSNPVDQRGRAMFRARFIHSEVYRARPDVRAVIHSHSPTVITVQREPGAVAASVSLGRVSLARRSRIRAARERRHDGYAGRRSQSR